MAGRQGGTDKTVNECMNGWVMNALCKCYFLLSDSQTKYFEIFQNFNIPEVRKKKISH